MIGLDLMQKFPLSAKIVNDWFTEKMIESLNNDKVPEEFKEHMREQGVSVDMIGQMIDMNPHALFQIFDDRDIYIHIIPMHVYDNGGAAFHYVINNINYNTLTTNLRKECESWAVEKAFELLEERLERNNIQETALLEERPNQADNIETE
jgi:hypothetical protein